MSFIVVSPLDRIAEIAVRHGARSMISLVARHQDFHRPATIDAQRHLVVGVNDIAAPTDTLVLAGEHHVSSIIDFVRDWDRADPLLIHCWMGISRSPAAALLAALALCPDQDDRDLAMRLRAAAPSATPNPRIVALADAMLDRHGRLVAAVEAIGRGVEASQGAAFRLAVEPDEKAAVSDG